MYFYLLVVTIDPIIGIQQYNLLIHVFIKFNCTFKIYWDNSNSVLQLYLQNIFNHVACLGRNCLCTSFFGCIQFAIPSVSFQTFMASQQLKALTLVVIINPDDFKLFLCGYFFCNCQLWPVI